MLGWLMGAAGLLVLGGLLFQRQGGQPVDLCHQLGRVCSWTLAHAVAPAISGVVAGLMVAVLLLDLGPEFAELASLKNPTCEDTRGAKLMPVERIEVDGEADASTRTRSAGPGAEAYVRLDFDEATPSEPFPIGVEEGDWDLENIIDGNSRTVWVPRDEEVSKAKAHMRFSMTKATDVAMVCIVTGNPVSEVSYQNAGRPQTVRVSAGGAGSEDVTLKSRGVDEMQSAQLLAEDLGTVSEVELTIVDTYEGLNAYDFERDEAVKASGHTAIAEVVFYRVDPDVPSPWSLLWPRW